MEFQFANPMWLWLLAALPFLVMWRAVIARRWRGRMRYSDLGLMQGISVGPRRALALLPGVLRQTALALLILAMARPQAGNVQRDVLVEGVDIMLVLDCSESMAARDFPPHPNRLEAAKRVIGDFVQNRETDRIGLIVFGEASFTVCPLTVDYTALRHFLSRVRIGVVPANGTAIGTGLLNAWHRMRDSDAKSRVVILLTDGDNNAQPDPVAVARLASVAGIRVYTIGIGPRNPQLRRQGFNPALLEAVAAHTGGRAFFAEDARALAQIYDEIDKLERSDVEYNVFAQWDELMAWLLFPALGVFLLEMILRQTRFMVIP